MIRISFAGGAFSSGDAIPLDRIIARLGAAEYDGIELSGLPACVPLDRYSTSESRHRLARRLHDHHLAAAGYAADFKAVNPLADGNKAPYLDLFRRALDLCRDIDCPSIRVNTVAAAGSIGEWEHLSAFDRLAGVWSEAAEISAAQKVRLLWCFESGFAFNKPSEIVALHRKVGHPNFQVLFHIAQACLCGSGGRQSLTGGVPEFLKKLEGRVGAVHLIDCAGAPRPFGEGCVDFNILAPQLLDIPNARWWCVDLTGCADAWNLIESSRDFVLSLLNSKVAA